MNRKRNKIQSTKDQYLLFDNIKEKAEYSNNYSEIERMVVDDSSSIWLENATGFYAQIVEALPISVYVKDENSNFTYVNAKGRSMLKFSEKVIIGEKDLDVLDDKKAVKLFQEEDYKVRNEGRKRSITEEWINHVDETITSEATRYPITQRDGKIVGVVSIADDITWKQKALAGQEIVHMITHDWVTGLLKDFGELMNKSSDFSIKTQSIIFDFVLEYLDNLYIYYDFKFSSPKFQRRCGSFNLKEVVLEPILEICKYYNSRDKNFTIPETLVSQNLGDISCNPSFLKILIYQQVRNHVDHGEGQTILKIIINKIDDEDYQIIFKSPGIKIADSKGLYLSNILYDSNIRSGERGHLGLFVCKKIATIHKGNFDYRYEIGEDGVGRNCFIYGMKNLN